jgi:hypothetical protein
MTLKMTVTTMNVKMTVKMKTWNRNGKNRNNSWVSNKNRTWTMTYKRTCICTTALNRTGSKKRRKKKTGKTWNCTKVYWMCRIWICRRKNNFSFSRRRGWKICNWNPTCTKVYTIYKKRYSFSFPMPTFCRCRKRI